MAAGSQSFCVPAGLVPWGPGCPRAAPGRLDRTPWNCGPGATSLAFAWAKRTASCTLGKTWLRSRHPSSKTPPWLMSSYTWAGRRERPPSGREQPSWVRAGGGAGWREGRWEGGSCPLGGVGLAVSVPDSRGRRELEDAEGNLHPQGGRKQLDLGSGYFAAIERGWGATASSIP